MNKDTKKAVKQLLQSGALSLLEEVVTEIKATITPPKFVGNTDLLTYETGEYNGVIKAYDLLFENLTEIATDV